MAKRVVVVDYGIGNVFSVCNALRKIGADPQLTGEPHEIVAADRVILPGVGAFSRAIANLRSHGHDAAIAEFVETGRPFLGICIGMQVLMDYSTEFGTHKGLGLIAGSVERISNRSAEGQPLSVPHISWGPVSASPTADGLAASVLGPAEGQATEHFYFVHSFSARPDNETHVLASTRYGGNKITAAVGRNNVLGVQFHPERSGPAGLAFLDRFLRFPTQMN